MTLKDEVVGFWDSQSCGEALYLEGDCRINYMLQLIRRYQLEPEILEFAHSSQYQGKKTPEIGVGLGADHQMLAEAGALLHGVDITPRAIAHTKKRLELMHLTSELQVADAGNLPFPDETFDSVYSWGVLHHSPNTAKVIAEVFRVLKPGGECKIMIYHKYSMIGFMLWIRYALMKGKPFRSLNDIYFHHLESPGTKAYSIQEAKNMFNMFSSISIKTHLTHGDLLSSAAGQRHRGVCLSLAKKLWPRGLIKIFLKNQGLDMMIFAQK